MGKQLITIKKLLNNADPEANLEAAKLNMYSVTVAILLSTEFFHRNSDIQPFLLKNKIIFKDYVFRSRTLLLARVLRTIEKMNEKELNLFKNSFNELLISNEDLETNKSSNKHREKHASSINPVDKLLGKYGRK